MPPFRLLDLIRMPQGHLYISLRPSRLLVRILSVAVMMAMFGFVALAQKDKGAQSGPQSPVIVVMAGQPLRPIGHFLSVYTDSTRRLSLGQVIAKAAFAPSNKDVLNLGIGEGAHWIKLNLTNATRYPELLINLEQPVLDGAEVYVMFGGKLQQTQSISPINNFFDRAYQHQNLLFKVQIPIGQTTTVYLKVWAEEALHLPVKLGTEAEILQDLTFFDFLSGLYYGLMLVMIFYNLFIWFSLRDPLYLLYVLYVICVAFTQICLQGYGYRFLWPGSPQFQVYAVLIAGASSGISTILFIKPILQMRQRAPKLDMVMLGIFGLYLFVLLVILLDKKVLAYNLIDLGALLGALTILAAAITISVQGYRPAKFILVSWTMFLISVIVFVLKDFDLVPHNSWTNYSLLIGSGVETILLSIALADRINILKLEKEQSQAETISALVENEKLVIAQNNLVKEQNVILEQKVEARTLSLQQSNTQLSVALTDLKEAQTQLVDAEKMATLGQLTAGIAHEINNPINFVISNIQPLRRDFEDIKEVLTVLETATTPAWDNEKAVEAKKLIKDLELDYLLEEVQQLLNGIDEGAKRTSEIVIGLRNFSRLDERSMKKASINSCLDSTLILLNSITKTKIEMVRDFAVLPDIDCQPGKINQVFMNILTNAIQATELGTNGQPPKIIIQTQDLDHEVMIQMTDNGPGMKDEVKQHIFEPFFSTKEVGKGTGLGLSIVHGIVKAHNGRIEVDSVVGSGSSFRIFLPKEQL